MKITYGSLASDERTEAELIMTTEHPCSHYGQPVFLLPDGNPVDALSWATLGYKIEDATAEELSGWRDTIGRMIEMSVVRR